MGIEVSIGLRFGAKTSMTTNTHPAFELLREQSIPSLKLHYQEYRHRVTGAQQPNTLLRHPKPSLEHRIRKPSHPRVRERALGRAGLRRPGEQQRQRS